MANPNSSYQSPLQGRYASPAMLKLFSNDTRYGTWRRLWVALAETEMELGLPVTATGLYLPAGAACRWERGE